MRLDYLSANPFRKLKPTRVEKRENKPLSLEQIKSVISCTRAQFQPILSFLAYTGCRSCEAYALKWKPVDFDKNEILIDAGRVFGIEGTPKTKAGRRVITMLPPVVAALKSLRGTASVVDMGRHVFLTQHGHPFNDNKPLNRAWTKALKKAGITHRRLYELRHSFASNMLVAGLPVAFISKMIGHANPATTYSYYAADVEAMRPQYALKMAEAVTGN